MEQNRRHPELRHYSWRFGLNGREFAKCLDTKKYQDKVALDKAEAASFFISGTPGTFVNGTFLPERSETMLSSRLSTRNWRNRTAKKQPAKMVGCFSFGADDQNRTDDLRVTSASLCQLSYTPRLLGAVAIRN